MEGDWSCDNRLLWRAQIEAGHRIGVRDVPGFVHRVISSNGRVSGVQLADGSSDQRRVRGRGEWCLGTARSTDFLIFRCGLSRARSSALTPGRLPAPSLTIRAYARGSEIYLVPREGGREVVLGATVEELGFDHRVTAGGVYELLRDGRTVMPMTAEYTLAETSVGWRPGTPDNATHSGTLRYRGPGAGDRPLPQWGTADSDHR